MQSITSLSSIALLEKRDLAEVSLEALGAEDQSFTDRTEMIRAYVKSLRYFPTEIEVIDMGDEASVGAFRDAWEVVERIRSEPLNPVRLEAIELLKSAESIAVYIGALACLVAALIALATGHPVLAVLLGIPFTGVLALMLPVLWGIRLLRSSEKRPASKRAWSSVMPTLGTFR